MTKPRYRIKAGSTPVPTHDSFSNLVTRLGVGGGNSTFAGVDYTPNYLSRLQVRLEGMYRGSWLVGAAVDCVAEDMTRAGVEYQSEMPPEDLAKLARAERDLNMWSALREATKWARLYGGALIVMLIDGQDPETPLLVDRVGLGGLRGLIVLDRWMVLPDIADLIETPGPEMGLPASYTVMVGAPALAGKRIHHSRVLRFTGLDLPWRQRQIEQYWGQSVIERIYDRLVAYDSTTAGAAQLVGKAYLRTLKIDGLRDLIASGGALYDAVVKNLEMIRAFQSSEGMTLLDSSDAFETSSYTFSGLSDLLLQFGQQFSGALGIPLVRLFGQSPSGLNSTGESDWENYYNNILQQQETHLRWPLTKLLAVHYQSTFGKPMPEDFDFEFTQLWQMRPGDRADVAQKTTAAILAAHDAGVVSPAITLRELKQSAPTTGLWSNITDQDIDEAEQAPPALGELDLGAPPADPALAPPLV